MKNLLLWLCNSLSEYFTTQWKLSNLNHVGEPISTSTPQMIYKVKHVSRDSQKQWRKQRRGNNYDKKVTIYCRFYKSVKFVVKFVVVISLISWLVSVGGNGWGRREAARRSLRVSWCWSSRGRVRLDECCE